MDGFKNKSSVFARLNNAASDLAQAQIAKNNELSEAFTKHIRDAGEALSQAIELAMKHHLDKHLRREDRNYFRFNNIALPDLCRKYIEDNGQPGDYYNETVDDTETPTVNFAFLRDNKRKVTNDAKHGGTVPEYDVQVKYFVEIKKFIQQYIDPTAPLKSISDFTTVDVSNWDLLYTSCDKFIQEERNYVLIIGENSGLDQQYLMPLSLCPWNLIFDFDYKSRSDGFFKAAFSEASPSPNLIKPNDQINNNTFSPYSQTHYHYFANSYEGSGISAAKDFNSWMLKYLSPTSNLISAFSSVFPNQKTIVLILYPDFRYVNKICELLFQNLAESVSFITANDAEGKLSQIHQFFKATPINIGIPELSINLRGFSSNFVRNLEKAQEYSLPFLSTSETKDVTGILSVDEYSQLEENFEVFHLGLPLVENIDDRRSFLSGAGNISPYGLKNRFDVERQGFNRRYVKPIEKQIERGKAKIFLQHEAGFGGTTIARRIAWEIHSEYPTLVLKKYREGKVKESLSWLHQKTRKTAFVVLEVPQTITLDEFDAFYRTIPSTRPVTFLVVKRGKAASNDLAVADWGNDIADLIKEYKPYIDELKDTSLKAQKLKEIGQIPLGTELYKKTPFYIGLLCFDDHFFAIKPYINNFVVEIAGNESQRRALIYLAIVSEYLGQGLPALFFRSNFAFPSNSNDIFKLEKYFAVNSTICESLLVGKTEGKQKYWQLRHTFLARELKKQLLGGNTSNAETWKYNLADACINLIEDSVAESTSSEYIEDLLQKLFIGNRRDRAGEDFSTLINDIPTTEDKERIFVSLKDSYPDNPHYWSHLARFYAYKNKNYAKAIEHADQAIELSRRKGIEDPLLHHIKGMCLRIIAYDAMDTMIQRKNEKKVFDQEDYDKIIFDYIPRAEAEFTESRRISNMDNRLDAHGYVAHIQLLAKAIDFGRIMSGESKNNFISGTQEPFASWIDMAEGLLEDVRGINQGEDQSIKIDTCENDIDLLYENYDAILQRLGNQLPKSSEPARTRRQIVRIYMKKSFDYYKEDRIVNRILELLEQNILHEPDNPKNFFLWFQAARHSRKSIDEAIAKLTQWKAQSSAIEPIFYLYILKVIKALEGYTDASVEASKLISECRVKGKNRITIYEYYGLEKGLKRIVSRNDFQDDNKADKLALVDGYFTNFDHIGDGTITIAEHLKVFFSPTRAKLTSSDLNRPISFYLGFSYEGLRADSHSVRLKD